jgi:hypothetical protein
MIHARKRLLTGSIVLVACLSSVAAAAATGTSPLAGAPAARSRGPVATAALTCRTPHYPSVGYFTSLTVTNTKCSTGTRFVLAFFKCRTKSGLAGKCRTTVLGFKCKETRNSIPTEIDARDTCRHGRERIVSTWQQDID